MPGPHEAMEAQQAREKMIGEDRRKRLEAEDKLSADPRRNEELRRRNDSVALTIGLAWCTFFKRSFWKHRGDLRDAYRAPGLFATKMQAAGHGIEFVVCDEPLEVADFDGSKRRLQDSVDLLYVLSHGAFSAAGYDALLHLADWSPGATGIGHGRLRVVVFDTCELIKTAAIPNWQGVWGAAVLGTSLRLLLGFDGTAVIDRGSAERGKAFAENLLAGGTFSDAWRAAVSRHVKSQYRRSVAIGVGDTVGDAQAVLNTASLAAMPTARAGTAVSLKEQY